MRIEERFEQLSLVESKEHPGLLEPKPDERIMLRYGDHGNLGYLVRKDGQLMVRRNLPRELILSPWSPDSRDWQEVGSPFELGPGQAAMVAFAADRALLSALARYQEARVDWLSLREADRIAFMKKGPTDHPVRAQLYKSIMELLT